MMAAADVAMLKDALEACTPPQIEAMLRDRLARGDWSPQQREKMADRIRKDAWDAERNTT